MSTTTTSKKNNHQGDSSVVIPPQISSGFARRRTAIFSGLLFLSVVYYVIVSALKDNDHYPDLLKPAPQFCPTNDGDDSDKQSLPCNRSDLLAFQVSSGIMQFFMGGIGFLAWIWTRSAFKSAGQQTPEGRLFGYVEDADKLNAGIFVFQVWDFVFSLLIPEHCTVVFLSHHVMTAITAYFSLEYQLVHHYAIYFGGCSEISTIFLVFCDFDVYFPSTDRGSTWGGFILFCQVAFTLTFLWFRVINWWIVSYQLWSDVLYVRRKKLAHQYRPGKAWFVYFFLAADTVLGGLQLYWFFFGIVPKIFEVLNSGGEDVGGSRS